MHSPAGVPKSALARELGKLSPREFESLGIPPWAPIVAEAIVRLTEITRDAESYSSWMGSISAELERLFDGFDWAPLASFLDDYLILDGGESEREFQQAVVEFGRQWHSKLRNGGYVVFARRLLGGSRFDSLTRALREDGAVVAWAARAVVRAGLPVAQAWADVSDFAQVPELKYKLPEELRSVRLIELASRFDSFVETMAGRFIPREIIDNKVGNIGSRSRELELLVGEARGMVTRQTHQRLKEASEVYLRKVRGARTTLHSSEDGISQAAHSLVELVDRVLREYIDSNDAAQWIQDNTSKPKEYLYTRDEKTLPTKRGEAVCFVYGAAPGEVAKDSSLIPSPLHLAIANAIVAARTVLQRIKHADKGTEEERVRVESLIAGIESALYIAYLLASWTGIEPADDDDNEPPI